MHDEQAGATDPAGAPHRGDEVRATAQPGAGREHAGQAESFERPLDRRAARIARPARVRMRRRNPWVLARRRLLGWNVRLLTRGLLDLKASVVHVVRHLKGVAAAVDGSTGQRYGRLALTVKRAEALAEADSDAVPQGEKDGGGLWTTACCRPSHVVSVSPVVRRSSTSPSRRPEVGSDQRPEQGSLAIGHFGATYVHRLWTTMWTAPAGAGRVAGRRWSERPSRRPDTRGMTG